MSGLSNPYPGRVPASSRGAAALARQALVASPALAWSGIAMLLLSAPVVLLAGIDERLLQGVSVWLKPWKFLMSSAVYLLTLALVFVWLPPARRGRAARRYVEWAAIGSAVFEVGYISWQAAWGQASHFNFSSPFTTLMYSLMGLGAVVLTSTAFVQGWMVLRSPGFGLGPVLRQGIGWGLVLTFLLGTGFGAYLAAQPTGHWVGGSLSDGGGLAVVKWSRDGGDLRVAHFFGIHAVHFIALFAWGLDRFFTSPAGRAGGGARSIKWVWLFCLAYTVFCVWTFVQAIRGQPFFA